MSKKRLTKAENKFLVEETQKMQVRHVALSGIIERMTKEFVEFFEANQEYPHASLDACHLFAALFNTYNQAHDGKNEDRRGCAEQAIGWAISAYYALQVSDAIKQFHIIHDACLKQGFEQKKSFEYNDLDNHCFAVPVKVKENVLHPTRKALCITTQNLNFLFVWQSNCIGERFHIRRYWDDYEIPDGDSFRYAEAKRFQGGGIHHAIVEARDLAGRYSDCL